MNALELATRWAAPTYVLVVDDDAVVLSLCTKLFGHFGLVVDTASNVEEARKCISEQDYRAIFVDLHLGDATALDLMPDVPTYVPTILFTGRLDSPILEKVLDVGPVALLRKPHDFTPPRIQQVLTLLNIRYRVPEDGPAVARVGHRLYA